MADRSTVIYGNQIKDATVTEDELAASVAGDGLSGGAGSALALDLNELTGAVVDVATDSIAIVDNSDSDTSRKELIADLVSAMAGSGLTANSGVLSADAVVDNIVEGDIAVDNFSATTNGALTDFDLTTVPLTASLQVFINGVYAEEGAGKDYELNPDSGQTKTIRIAGDILATGEKLIAHYITNN